MKNFCSIKVTNDKLELFSSKCFNPIVGALKGYEDCFFKFVNRGTLVESTPVIHKSRGPNAEVKGTLMDGTTLFYAKVDNTSNTFSKCKNKVFETKNGFKIRNASDKVVYNLEFIQRNGHWWKRSEGQYSDVYKSLEEAKQQGIIDIHNKLLEIERSERKVS